MSTQQFFNKVHGKVPSENYERYFVPAIGKPLSLDLIRLAALHPGARVLDVACGTGIVARLAAQQVGPGGTVAGVDANAGMLAVARAVTPAELSIEWHEMNAEDMSLPDEAFDVVLCQLGFQFMQDKLAALREMRRVLAPHGKLILTVPGPMAKLFAVVAQAMEQHVGPQAVGFVTQIFSLHDTTEIQNLLREADFRDIVVQADNKVLTLPPPKEYLWQYVGSTPLAGIVANVDEKSLAALERDVIDKWQEFEEEGHLIYRQRIVTASARK